MTCLAVLALFPAAGATPLSFHAPASFEAIRMHTESLSWVLLVFGNGTAAGLDLDSRGAVQVANDTVHHPFVAHQAGDRRQPTEQKSHDERRLAGPVSFRADFPARQGSSALIIADRIELGLGADVMGTIRTKPFGESLESFGRPNDADQQAYRRTNKPGGNDVVLSATSRTGGAQVSFHLSASHAVSVEWYNAAVSCLPSADCPDGGGPAVMQLGTVLDYSFSSEQHSYETLSGDLDVKAKGTLDYAVMGSTNLTVSLAGSVRLPLASTTDLDCDTCLAADGQTVAASGNITLGHLHRAPNGSISSDVDGDFDAARLDEAVIDPELLFRGGVAVGVAAAIGGGLAVLYVFGPLFTRNRHDDLLANARRRRIYDIVVRNPGIHIREALRAADVPAGAGRHHVNRLLGAGFLMAQRSQAVVLLFENNGKYSGSWRHTATLRDSNARLLFDWVAAHPSFPQKAILDEFQARHGWNRSTTQKRLERLERDGLVGTRMHGRYKVYSTLEGTPTAPSAIFPPVSAPAFDA